MQQRAKSTAGSGSSKPAPKKKQKKDPNAPKGASSAFMQFSASHRSAVKEAHPGLKTTEIAKVLGEKWKTMDDEAKAPYNEKANRDKER
ncbi:unnamed protein product, partial [Sphacelaria rigidula]